MPLLLPAFLLIQAAATPPAPWTPVSRTDPASGKTATSAFAMSRDGNARLAVRCDTAGEPVVSVQFRTRSPLAAGDDQPVSVKFDGADPIQAAWQFPGGAALNANPVAVTSLTNGMATAHSIVVSVGEGPLGVTETFDGPASADGIKAVLSACGYELGKVPAAPAKK